MTLVESKMAENSFDVVVVGGGPGGYVAAIRAAQLGMKTALVEREHLGGICLNWGCIPTKALLRSADVFRNMQHAASYGLSAQGLGFDLAAIVKRSRGVAAQLSAGVKGLLKKNKVTVFDGHGKLAGKGKLAAWNPTASSCGPTRKPWCPTPCRRTCWSSARAPSASNSPASSMRWAPTLPWLK
jgi:pyruvate/2-oxoglutarate dehydrogenase complex dihydrolipoamide dehydrogenase (E3) component